MAFSGRFITYGRFCRFGILHGQNWLLDFLEEPMSTMHTSEQQAMPRWRQYWVLTKPRVTQLAVFCAVIGMFLATPGMVPYPVLFGGIVGIWLLASAAFAMNCLIEQAVDAKMKRTSWRPSATGEVTPFHIVLFSIVSRLTRNDYSVELLQSLDDVVNARNLCWLCSDLYLVAETC
jgi:hypothetical protein